MRRRTTLAALGAAAALAAGAAPAHANAPALEPALERAVDAGSPGALVLSRTDGRTVAGAAGLAATDPRRPARPRDRFRAGSITKSFVATIVLQLASEHRLGLDDTVERRLPGLLPGGGAITLRQLLNHTSGLADYVADPRVNEPFVRDPDFRWPPRELAEIAATLPPIAAPGAGWSYANTNYLLLGLVVERVTGRSLRSVMRQRILRPLRLRRTSLPDRTAIAGRHLRGYLPEGGRLVDVSGYSPSSAWAAGALVSTQRDIATFYRALLRGRLLPPAQLAEMRTIAPVARLGRGGYGLGLLRIRLSCGNAWGHDGETLGNASLAVSSPDGRRQAVVTLNRTGLTPELQRAELALLDAAFCRDRG